MSLPFGNCCLLVQLDHSDITLDMCDVSNLLIGILITVIITRIWSFVL